MLRRASPPTATSPATTPRRSRRQRTSTLHEPRVDVRPVDRDVAARAVAEARLDVGCRRDGVAFVAELRDLLAHEEVAVDAPVRVVAAHAALGHHARVLEDVRALDVAVTAEAADVVGAAHGRRGA